MDSEALNLVPFRETFREDVIALWEVCGLTTAWNNPDRDIDRKLSVDPERFLLGFLGQQLVATIMVGYDGHRGWVNYLAVAPTHRTCGIGRKLMDAAEAILVEAGCPKLNLQVRTSNQGVLDFYQRLGYKRDEVVSLGKRLIPD